STVTLGFQLLKNVTNTWKPSIRFVIGETFPTGSYQNLDPTKNGTDVTGTGAYQTNIGLRFQNLWEVGETRYLRNRLALGYTFASSSNISGVNAFGGNNQTSGKEKIGDSFSADLAFEYTLTKHWVPAIDFYYTTSGSSTFTGETGTTQEGLPAIA